MGLDEALLQDTKCPDGGSNYYHYDKTCEGTVMAY
jgi:hypothetical protein